MCKKFSLKFHFYVTFADSNKMNIILKELKMTKKQNTNRVSLDVDHEIFT